MAAVVTEAGAVVALMAAGAALAAAPTGAADIRVGIMAVGMADLTDMAEPTEAEAHTVG